MFILLCFDFLLHGLYFLNILWRGFFNLFNLFLLSLRLLIFWNFLIKVQHIFSNKSIFLFFWLYLLFFLLLVSLISFGLEWISQRKSLYFLIFICLLFDHIYFLFGRFWHRLLNNLLLLLCNYNLLLCDGWFSFSFNLFWNFHFFFLYWFILVGLIKLLRCLFLLLLSWDKDGHYLFLLLLNNLYIFLSFLFFCRLLSLFYRSHLMLRCDLFKFWRLILFYFFYFE